MIAGRCFEVLGPLGRGDDQRDAAVGLLAAVQQPQRFGDPPRGLVLLDGDRLPVEVRLRVVGGVLAVGDRHRAEVLARRAGQVHVALGDHRHLRRGRRQPVRVRERVVDAGRVGVLHQPHLHLTEPHPRPLVERAVCHDAVRDAGGDGHGRLLHGRARRPAAVMDLGEELQIPDAGGARDGDLGVGVHRERRHAVHVGGRQARVVERVEHRLGGQPQLAAAGVLREVGGADADDRGLAGQAARVTPDRERRVGDDVIAKAVGAHDLQRDQVTVDRSHLTGERHRVIGVPGHAEPQTDRLDHRGGPRPVGDVTLHQTGVGEDVDEDVLGPLGLGLVPVVVHVLVVAGRDGGRHDERRVAVELEFGQLGPDSMGALMPCTRQAPTRSWSRPARRRWPGSRCTWRARAFRSRRWRGRRCAARRASGRPLRVRRVR